MTPATRGMIWLLMIAAALGVLAFSAANALWRAGDDARADAARFSAIAENRELAQRDLEAWRDYASSLSAGYISAASAAEAEATLRERIGDIAAEMRAELSSIQSRPAERDDPDGLLRVRVVMTAPQNRLSNVLNEFRASKPATIVEFADIRFASGVRRPGAQSKERPLQLTVDVTALWREGRDG